jgi:hypothetical protein
MNNDLERMWRETIMQFFKTYSRNLSGIYYGKQENCFHADIETRTFVMEIRGFAV